MAITKEQALTANNFTHVSLTNKSDKLPVRARRNGKTQTWKNRPNAFRIPAKYGVKGYFSINQDNADQWNVAE